MGFGPRRVNEMGYDMKIEEDDELVVEITDYETGDVIFHESVTVKEGQKLSVELYGVKESGVGGIQHFRR